MSAKKKKTETFTGVDDKPPMHPSKKVGFKELKPTESLKSLKVESSSSFNIKN